jgi:hypothetical protein
MEADVAKIKEAMFGNWESIAPELRPSAGKNPDGTLKPFYLKRASNISRPIDLSSMSSIRSTPTVQAYEVFIGQVRRLSML